MQVPLQNWLKDAIILLMGFLSLKTTSKALREKNGFSWFPIQEVAYLFAGIFILTDAPYKIGDFVVLEGNLRGMVTQIGIRSTRILTRDDVEVTIPNSIMGNSKVVNESGGPHLKYRIRVKVGVAYGSDIDLVQNALLPPVVGAQIHRLLRRARAFDR